MKNHIKKLKNQGGFTLIELLVVIGILAVLLAIVLIAINPQQHFQDSNNTKRRADVNAILNAVHQYALKNGGSLPAGIDGTAKTVTSTAGASNLDLCSSLVPTYIADLPIDPSTGTESPADSACNDGGATYDTQYTITQANNRVTVAAPDAEGGETIEVTR